MLEVCTDISQPFLMTAFVIIYLDIVYIPPLTQWLIGPQFLCRKTVSTIHVLTPRFVGFFLMQSFVPQPAACTGFSAAKGLSFEKTLGLSKVM